MAMKRREPTPLNPRIRDLDNRIAATKDGLIAAFETVQRGQEKLARFEAERQHLMETRQAKEA
ncbi:hypothetical protein [Aurantimonas coralicida]|uniref:hypothetical protein n=1 Tax=Aurantimonas coralicida TaxID=182270 RepID=UPI00040FE7D1|nr:hypothetical protein [Aurantimonas coralicida]